MARTGIRASAVIIKNKKILLIHRRKESKEYWSFPGGGVEEGETPKETICREVEEETGLGVLTCQPLFSYSDNNGIIHPVFVCRVKDGEPVLSGPEKDKDQKIDWYHPEWVDLDKVENLTLYPLPIREKVIKEII